MEHVHQNRQNHYTHLGLMALLSFLAMYLLMYSMVDTFASVYRNFNQVYMAALMTAPMVVIEPIVLRRMYRDARLNRLLIAVAVIGGVAMLIFIRKPTGQ